jgi:hypothetical protein
MANVLPKDEELFTKIAREHIQVDPVLWNVIYQYIGNTIMAINFQVRLYIDDNQPVPKKDAQQILDYTKRLIDVIKKLDNPQDISPDEKDELFRTIKQKNLKLDPVTKELFTNYIRNDLNIINIICGTYVDPLDKREAVSVPDAQKILDHTRSTVRFLDRLREATSKREVF